MRSVSPVIQLELLPGQEHCRRRDAITQELHHFLYGVVNCFSSVSTTNTANSFAGALWLAFSLTLCRSPGISEKLSPVRYVTTGPSLTELRIAPSRTVA